MKARAAGLSDVGRCRERNQDQYVIDATLGLYAVADGMGGHAAGEVASRLAIEALSEAMQQTAGDPEPLARAPERLRSALVEGNRRICESTQSHAEWRGMGTTLVALLAVDGHAVIGHVGDSRAYRLRRGRLERMTRDHSWVSEQVEHGLLTDEEAQRHPMRNIVTRALGNQRQVEVEVTTGAIEAGDVFLLCSDGLNSMLRDEEIFDALAQRAGDPQAACRALVDLANASGGDDNVTVIVVSMA